MAKRFLPDLAGTLLSTLRIATSLFKTEDATTMALRTKADDAYIDGKMNDLIIVDPDTGNTITLSTDVATTHVIKLPNADGSTGQALITDGSGNWAWATVATGSNAMKSQTHTIGFGTGDGAISIFTPPQNAVIHRAIVIVDTAFDGNPTLSVGVTAATARYMQTTQNELDVIDQIWETQPMYEDAEAVAGDREVFATWVAGSATVGSLRVITTYSNPD